MRQGVTPARAATLDATSRWKERSARYHAVAAGGRSVCGLWPLNEVDFAPDAVPERERCRHAACRRAWLEKR